MALDRGARLGHYEIVAPLGAGGMGEVYEARDTQLGRHVAVKVLPAEVAADPGRLARFEHEARAASALNHPNIVTIHEVGREGTVVFLVMEQVEGRTLREIIQQGALPVRKALQIGGQVAAGLAKAHAAGIVHRDIKPDNLMVSDDGVVKILDFGLAKSLHAGPESGSHLPTMVNPATSPGVAVGTIDYMSPEQARGAPLDPRSDQFSLGTVMYEMLSGVRPFRGESAPQTLTAIIEKTPAPIARDAVAVPAPVIWIIDRCLSKDPADRYASTIDLARDLRFALEHLSELSSTGPVGPAPASALTERRGGRLGWIAAGVLIGAMAASAATALLLRPSPRTPPPLRILTFSGGDQGPAASPDGRTLAFASARDGVWRLWLKQVAGGIEVPLTAGPDLAPRFSPDGSSILFTRIEGDGVSSLYRVPALGGEPRKAIHDAVAGDWSPDGREIAFVRWTSIGGRTTGEIGIAGVDGGNERVVHRIDNVALGGIRFSPDGRWVVSNIGQFGLSEGAGKYLLLLRTDGSESRRIVPPIEGGDLSVPAWLASGRELVYAQGESVTTVSIGTTMVNSGATRFWRQDISGGDARILFWTPSLVRVVDPLAPGRLVFDAATAKENLREYDLAAPGDGATLSQGASLDRQPIYSPDGEWIAFSSNRSGNLDIWAISTSTGTFRRLTDDAADDWDPAFTPDGSQMIWTSRRSGNFEIWMADADGSGARQVTRDGVDAENATITRDGAWLVYNSGNPAHTGLWKVRTDGSDAIQIVSGTCQWPEVSPDGRFVSYSVPLSRDLSVIRVVRVEDGSPVPFEISLPGGAASNGRHRWMPDGRGIVFSWTTGASAGVYLQDFAPGTDTLATRRILVPIDPPTLPETFGISPDGTRLTVAVATGSWTLMSASDIPDLEPPHRR